MEFALLGGFVLFLFGCLAIVIIGIGIYNALLATKENVHKAWANIDVILKQRYDEIPQLINICSQYVSYEEDMINRIMSAREKMVKGKSINEKADASNEVTSAIGGLLAVGENYPELKANQNFIQIQSRLSELEERLADRREFYNDSVNVYNIRIQQIPDVFFAGMMNYQRMEMFEIKENEKSLPDLNIKRRSA